MNKLLTHCLLVGIITADHISFYVYLVKTSKDFLVIQNSIKNIGLKIKVLII